MKKFLGRIYNEKTAMWEHTDGSGISFPEEVHLDIIPPECSPYSGIVFLAKKWAYEERHWCSENCKVCDKFKKENMLH